MCGITGIVNQSNNPVNPEELKSANNLVAHRGPDGEGTYFGANFALGHRRLAIIDLSEKGNQPMTYHENVIIHNGEVYNYLELREELTKFGYSFRSETDTEVILAAYDYWGEDCVNHFNGMWSFAIFDKKNNKLFCSRDRFGIKPFYYTIVKDKFCFASEIKQFTGIQGWRARMNQVRVYEFLVVGFHDHTQETFFKDVLQLKKGHNLIYDLAKHTFELKCFYKIPTSINSSITFEEAKDKFKAIFQDAIRLRLRSDVKVGSALSGGLDSSSVVGVIHQLLESTNKSDQQETVSACFPGFEKDESFWIDEVVNQYNVKAHKVFPSFENFFDDLRMLTWQQDEPVAGASLMAQHLVFNTAKQNGISVMLDGQGADEILSGYDKFYYSFFKNLMKKNPVVGLWELIQYFKLHNVHPFDVLKAISALNKKGKREQPNWLNKDFNFSKSNLFIRTEDKPFKLLL